MTETPIAGMSIVRRRTRIVCNVIHTKTIEEAAERAGLTVISTTPVSRKIVEIDLVDGFDVVCLNMHDAPIEKIEKLSP